MRIYVVVKSEFPCYNISCAFLRWMVINLVSLDQSNQEPSVDRGY